MVTGISQQILKMSSNAHMNTSYNGLLSHFQRSQGGYEWLDRHKECGGERSLHFQ